MDVSLADFEIWLVTGSQQIYGDAILAQVAKDSEEVASHLDRDKTIPVRVVHVPTQIDASQIFQMCQRANSSEKCVGLLMWMHTFSPAKMWIRGLQELRKPFMHLHTQFNRDIPWNSIDMDFMNLNQSAHGGREFGHIVSRLGIERRVVVGHWKEEAAKAQIGVWARAACGRHDLQGGKFARIGDNMREVAVTDGDKVEAEIQMGYSVNGYGVRDVVEVVDQVSDALVDELVSEYDSSYEMASDLRNSGPRRESLRDAARIELGLREFLTRESCKGFADTFQVLHGLKQLPGISAQRLMNQGYGFGAEGDWKTCALLRALKVMSLGLPGGNSFMEDYTYHFEPDGNLVLGAHMLEICESIASGKPRCEIHPLFVGGREDPVRLVFDVDPGPAINVTIVDLGHRFRIIVNEIDAVKPLEDLPNLPVARAVWKPRPSLPIAAGAWILAGGAHHTVYSQALTTGHIEDFAEMLGIELVVIDQETRIREFKRELRNNEAYYS